MVKPIFPALAPGGVPHPYCQDGHFCLRMRPAHWCQPEGGQLSIPAGFVGSDRQIEAVCSCSERPSSSRVPRPTCSTTEIVPLRLHSACGSSARHVGPRSICGAPPHILTWALEHVWRVLRVRSVRQRGPTEVSRRKDMTVARRSHGDALAAILKDQCPVFHHPRPARADCPSTDVETLPGQTL